jgi:hypothetical protein
LSFELQAPGRGQFASLIWFDSRRGEFGIRCFNSLPADNFEFRNPNSYFREYVPMSCAVPRMWPAMARSRAALSAVGDYQFAEQHEELDVKLDRAVERNGRAGCDASNVHADRLVPGWRCGGVGMSRTLRITLMLVFVAGFACGFAGLVVPNQTALLETPRAQSYQFQRLHIFLFNLVGGGTTLLWFTEGARQLSRRAALFMILALVFSLLAFLNQYALAIISAIALAVIVEGIRIRRYPWFPGDLFRGTTPVAEKFHHAALLCLSIALVISSCVMLNNQYLHVFDFLNLLLDDFFLGFSFPFSLLTFAAMFALMREPENRAAHVMEESSFWIVTVGVVVFFVFIILGITAVEIAISLILLGDVLLLFYLFRKNSRDLEQDQFLTSGMAFLTFTGVTGILILLWGLTTPQSRSTGWNLLFQIHAYLALYGWNLSGLAVVIRFEEFPLRLHDLDIILLHWVTIALLAPLGSLFPVFALMALPAFVALVWIFLFSAGHAHVATRKPDRSPFSTSFWRSAEPLRDSETTEAT